MLFYRVSRDLYSDGEELSPSKNYESNLTEEKSELEGVLDKYCPEGKRSDFIFLFDDIAAALTFLGKTVKDGKIYLVEAESSDLVYRGDMNKLDNTYDLFSYRDEHDAVQSKIVDEIIDEASLKYWKFSSTFLPCNEYLFKKAKVIRKIFPLSDKELDVFRREFESLGNRLIFCTTAYKKLYKQLYLDD